MQGLLRLPFFKKKWVTQGLLSLPFFRKEEKMFVDFLKLYPDDTYICVQELPKNGIPKKYCLKKEQLLKRDYTGKENIFFTPNSFGYRYNREAEKSFINRDREHLNYLQCLYVDIDLKNADTENVPTIEEALRYFDIHILNSEIVPPTLIINSGNGIHMYWKINTLHYKGNLECWDAVQEYIYEVFKFWGADRQVSKDRVRLMRVPGTLNVKENVKHCYIIRETENVYNLSELAAQYCKCVEEKKRYFKEEKKKEEKCKIVDMYYALYSKRVQDLRKLIQMRDSYAYYMFKHLKGFKTIMRENILFLIRYYLLELGYDEEQALNEIIEINEGLYFPLDIKEVIEATKSAEKYHHSSKLHWKNSDIISFLNMLPKEICEMCSIINTEEKKRRSQTRDRKRYLRMLQCAGKQTKKEAIMDRRILIYDLWKQGHTIKDICQLLNVGKSTCYKDITIIQTEEWQISAKEYIRCKEVQKMITKKATGTDGKERDVVRTTHFPKNSAPVISLCLPCSRKHLGDLAGEFKDVARRSRFRAHCPRVTAVRILPFDSDGTGG